MAYSETIPNTEGQEDPGAYWLRVIANKYPDQFISFEFPGIEEEPATNQEDEQGQAEQDPMRASGLFEHHRKAVRPLFREMLRNVFERFHLPKEDGIDVGSGMTGEMVNEWLPLSSEQRKTWTETDINPNSVQANRERHPGANVQVASMYELRQMLASNQKVPLITGLSSLDAPAFPDKAMAEIKHVLEPGGIFLHVQDVRPGIHMGINQLKHEGVEGPYRAVQARPPDGRTVNPHAYILPNGSLVSAVELLRRHLERTAQGAGLENIYSGWMYASERIEGPSSFIYNMNMRGPVESKFTNIPLNLAVAAVTVARKK